MTGDKARKPAKACADQLIAAMPSPDPKTLIGRQRHAIGAVAGTVFGPLA